MKTIIQPIFSSSFILFKDLGLDNNQMLKEFEELSHTNTNPDYKNKTTKSDSIQVLNELKSGEKIKNKINLCLDTAIKKIWKYNIDHTIVNSWITKTYPNCDSHSHTHKNFWLSAVYYPYSSGKFKIRFESERFDLTSYDIRVTEYNCFNASHWDYEVCTGDLIIFSAALRHKIYVNTTKDIRYSLAVNIMPRGEIGINDGTLIIY
jgi:hypothetical protein